MSHQSPLCPPPFDNCTFPPAPVIIKGITEGFLIFFRKTIPIFIRKCFHWKFFSSFSYCELTLSCFTLLTLNYFVCNPKKNVRISQRETLTERFEKGKLFPVNCPQILKNIHQWKFVKNIRGNGLKTKNFKPIKSTFN